MDIRENVRNVAIIAHVDHGKTTLVDQLLRQSGIFRVNEQLQDRVMDSNDLERERGITILAKNTSVMYNGTKINIVDTPGHADFGGEVERILTMIDGVLLLVDAFEGCMPQTRFVLKKAFALQKQPIVVVNKIDRPGARPEAVVDEILDLFIELGADIDMLDFPVIYASAKKGYSSILPQPGPDDTNMVPLFESIINNVPPPIGDMNGPLQILFCNIDYDEYLGRIGVGRVVRGGIKVGQPAILCRTNKTVENVKVSKLYQYEGLNRVPVDSAELGDIVAVAGIPDINIGETLCAAEYPDPLPFVKIDEPTISMNFIVNNSPFAGKEGKYVTSRHLRERLMKELETNISLRVEDTDSPDTLRVSGRGDLHLSILIETMRRQGYEFQISPPKVIFKEIDGVTCEPMELVIVDIDDEYIGVVMEKLGARKGEMTNMTSPMPGSTRLEFKMPSRCLMGYTSEFLTDTKGTGVINHILQGYEPYKGDYNTRQRGSIVAFEDGDTCAYGLYNAQDRGRLFLGAGVKIYKGMIVGENARGGDLSINVCKKKHITNMRASGSDETLRLTPPVNLSLEQCLEFLADDELLEVTPENLRMRKAPLR